LYGKISNGGQSIIYFFYFYTSNIYNLFKLKTCATGIFDYELI